MRSYIEILTSFSLKKSCSPELALNIETSEYQNSLDVTIGTDTDNQRTDTDNQRTDADNQKRF